VAFYGLSESSPLKPKGAGHCEKGAGRPQLEGRRSASLPLWTAPQSRSPWIFRFFCRARVHDIRSPRLFHRTRMPACKPPLGSM